ncbi:alpha-galactosidase [Aeromonas veronii]|uniref:alpha-galactosidase n=1 Tax=Aeromonas TaxID=642 RepID=UPI00191D7D24|nr:alpha-galactosidase [Aeromonas veronii]HEH9427761.1 alpha-galactosidase [Aeromonas sobria]MBL0473683.1 alpha-galactosidase [Aeromonas veronii]MCR3960966.1 alpha-galactosidase [Aeromonas veronii]MCX4043532.1 alpha-galactosidase [Aeromonas veronii]MDX7747897.1 alpha-galactosidase [Aeromonas veronii]
MEPTYRRLSSPHSNLIIKTHPYAEIVWWGSALQHFNPDDCISLERPVANGRLDIDTPLTLMAENGLGLFGSPGLEGHRNGLDASPVFRTVRVEQIGEVLTLTSEDSVAGLRMVSELILTSSGVLKMRHALTNLREGDWQVNRFAITLPVAERAGEVMAFHGRWTREFQPHRVRLTHDGFVLENRRGRTSHEHFPALIAGTPGFSEQQGEVWAAHLGWSGNHRMKCEVKTDGRRYLQAEALWMPGEKALKQDETLYTPWLYACHSPDGLNGMSQQYHRFLRDEIIHFPDQKPRLVHLNTWEGIYFDHNPDYIAQMAERAAALGVERFIIDDGWFKGRNDDHAALGDWYLDEQKYPDGLMPVINHVKSLGMEFGIWLEPEMINPDSDLFRLHPDWVLSMPGYTQPTGRHQYVLNLNIPEAFTYIYERFLWLLGEHPVDYVKWDMNRELVQAGHEGRAAVDSQTRQFYRLLELLRKRFPRVEFESCASGGGRIDFEVLARTHRFWASDNNDALERCTIQRGMSYFFPPEVMGAHIGSHRCHATFRQHSIAFRGLTALFGHMGLELDPVTASEDESAGYCRYAALYKKWRQLIHTGTLWRVDMPDVATQVQGVVSSDQTQALFLVSQLAMPDNTLPGTLRIPGLEAQARYRLHVVDHPDLQLVGEGGHTMRRLPEWMCQNTEVCGEWLALAGIQLPILDPESAMLIALERLA